MIFYFSGTGNSQAVAQVIATRQQEELVPMIQVDLTVPYLIKKRKHCFCFPYLCVAATTTGHRFY